jgi:ABC-type glutathione transport system ATPase component
MVAQYYHSIPDESEAMEALERVGLAERAHHLPSQLSGGEQQRVCVARALINHPKLVLADEPTGNLDEDNERRVLELFRSLHDAGAALIVVTHDPKVAGLGQRQIVLNHGRVVASEVNPARAAVDGVDHGQVAAGELNRDQRRNEDREVALDEGRDGIRKGTRDGSRDEDREVALDERREATREEGREGTREVSHA